MPRQNRVTPFGETVAAPARGTFMGNRGVLHNAVGEIVRPYQGKRWIICQLSFKERRRVVMTPGRYTELFFLDEATALAAGHRPCVECRRAAYIAFRDAWMAAQPTIGKGSVPIKVDEMDRVLHGERISSSEEKVTYVALLSDLPDGVFVVVGERPCLLWQGALFPWSANGYGYPLAKDGGLTTSVLTPRSTVGAIQQGYVPQVSLPMRW
ncbi:MAG TPA: hypothetical protein PLD25_30530 [Chloroflexota bacterium]|nr:hypothetical protein [Chloroflexota bacterium]HUM68024.1 hypothetical protein [Chloroflexota bacterium]